MMTSNPVWRWDRAVTLSALVANLMIWVGAATGQPPIAPPAVVVVPTALLHYQYCQTRTQQPLDDCLLERFTIGALRFLDRHGLCLAALQIGERRGSGQPHRSARALYRGERPRRDGRYDQIRRA